MSPTRRGPPTAVSARRPTAVTWQILCTWLRHRRSPPFSVRSRGHAATVRPRHRGYLYECGSRSVMLGMCRPLRRWMRSTEVAGAFGSLRASKNHALGNGSIRQLSAHRPAGYCGVRIGRRPGSSGTGGPCRGLVLRARITIRAVSGIRPWWSANPGCGRRLVRPARWPDRHPCSGLAAGQPQRQRRHGGVRRGYPARHPGTRPDMAGRQRQPVPVTRPAHPPPATRTPARLTPIRARYTGRPLARCPPWAGPFPNK